VLRFMLDQAQDVAFTILGKSSPSDPWDVVFIHKCHATQFNDSAKRAIEVGNRKVADVCVDEAVELRLARIKAASWGKATDDFRIVRRCLNNGPIVSSLVSTDKVPAEQFRVKRNRARRIRGRNVEVRRSTHGIELEP